MAHHRLFVAIRPPRLARAAMRGLMGGVSGARWQDDDQLHCTLRFLDSVDGRVAEDVATALLGLRGSAFEIETDGWGSFARAGAIDTLWLGIAPNATLDALHAKVGRLVLIAGVPADGRAYRAHVTLARFGRSAAPDAGVAARLPSPARIAFRVEDVRLFESILGRDGARYETIARYPLR